MSAFAAKLGTFTLTGFVPSEGLGKMIGAGVPDAIAVAVRVMVAMVVIVTVAVWLGVAVAEEIVIVAPVRGKLLKPTAWPFVPVAPWTLKVLAPTGAAPEKVTLACKVTLPPPDITTLILLKLAVEPTKVVVPNCVPLL